MDARPIYRWTKINLSFHSHTGSQAVGSTTIRGVNNSEMLHMNLVKNIPQFHKGLADPFFRVHLSSNISCKISISSLPQGPEGDILHQPLAQSFVTNRFDTCYSDCTYIRGSANNLPAHTQ